MIPAQRTDSKLTTHANVDQGSEDWLALRRGMVTASTIGRLVTSRSMTATEYDCPSCDAEAGGPCLSKVKRAGEVGSPIKTAHPERVEVAASKRHESPRVVELATGDEACGLTALLAAERITGHTDPTYVSDDMLRGIEEEPLAVDVYSKHYGIDVGQMGFMVRSWGGGRFKLGFSPDGLVAPGGLVEVKSRRQKKHLLTVVADEVPPENFAQLQAGLFVSGWDWIDYISYSAGMALWTKRVYPDRAWFDALIAAVESFEIAATAMVDAYHRGVAGMPLTERVEMEMTL